MSEDAQGTAASEQHQDGAGAPAPGSASDGSGGTETGADAFAAEKAALEARARTEQGRADREAARAAELERQLAEAQGAAGGAENTGEASPESNAAVDALTAEVRDLRRSVRWTNEYSPLVDSLKGENAHADPALFTRERAMRFETPEALKAAIEASHNERKTFGESYAEAQLAALRKQYADQYGLTLATPPANGGSDTPNGDPTPEQLARMSIVELDELGEEVVNRVLRSAI